MALWMSIFVSCGSQMPLLSVSIPEASAADTGWPDWVEEEDPEEPAPEAPAPEPPAPEPDPPSDP